jgi:hypothetical protein
MKREKTLWNGFFKVDHLNIVQKTALINDALLVSESHHVDILKSWKRESYDMTPENFISSFDLSDLKLVDRAAYRGFSTDHDFEISVIAKNEDFYNVFLWLYLSREDFYNIIDKYLLPKLLI